MNRITFQAKKSISHADYAEAKTLILGTGAKCVFEYKESRLGGGMYVIFEVEADTEATKNILAYEYEESLGDLAVKAVTNI
jgi:hypothetical protein